MIKYWRSSLVVGLILRRDRGMAVDRGSIKIIS